MTTLTTGPDHPIALVGLTGGIASGKSTVAALFEGLGVHIIDTDHLAHLLTGPGGAAIPAILESFGEEFVEQHGALDRQRMRQDVFLHPEHRKQLEEIIHPLIREAVERYVEQAHSPYVLIVIPLLFETKFFKDRLDRIVVVDCAENLQKERALKREGMTPEILDGILMAQASRADRRSIADDLISNDSDLEALRAHVESLDLQFKQFFKH